MDDAISINAASAAVEEVDAPVAASACVSSARAPELDLDLVFEALCRRRPELALFPSTS